MLDRITHFRGETITLLTKKHEGVRAIRVSAWNEKNIDGITNTLFSDTYYNGGEADLLALAKTKHNHEDGESINGIYRWHLTVHNDEGTYYIDETDWAFFIDSIFSKRKLDFNEVYYVISKLFSWDPKIPFISIL